IIKALQNPKIYSLEGLQNELRKKRIQFQYTVNKKEQVAVSFKYDGLAVKGTQVSLKGSLIKKQLLLNAKASLHQNEKSNFLQTIKETKRSFENSINEIVNTYNSGKTPDLKEIFAKNGIQLYDNYSIQYNNWNVELTTLQAFNEQCRKKLMIAKENYHSKIDAYLKLQNTEFKHGFWGFLTSEQKQFNKELEFKKQNTPFPNLEVGISKEDFLGTIQSKIDEIHNAIKATDIIHEKAYIIDESIDLEQKKTLKEEPSFNLSVLNSPTISEEEESQPKRKRKR